jgi:hypothetical protein
MKSFKDFLGPEATKRQDAAEAKRQKSHMANKAKEYKDQGRREGAMGAAYAKGINFDLAKDNIHEDLRQWFKQKWVRMDTKGNIKGHCARDPGEGKPKCLPQARAQALGKEGRAAAAQRKRREDPNPDRHGAPINVRTESAAAAIAAATAIAKKKSGNYDSDGFRKTPYKNPDSPMRKSNAQRKKEMEEACWPGYKRKKGTQEFAPGSCVKEDGEGGGGFAPAATNVVGGGAIAGSGGAGGEPGVSKKRNPVMSFFKRKKPKM